MTATCTVQHTLTFKLGTLVRLSASFTRPPTAEEIADGTACDADDMQPVDPDGVVAKVLRPGETIPSEHAYLDSPDDIVRDDTGQYHLDVSADAAGEWAYRFEGSGTAQSANEHAFKVSESRFYP